MKYLTILVIILIMYYQSSENYIGVGHSMEPRFKDSQKLTVFIHHAPKIGSSVVFECMVDKCHPGLKHKFVRKIEENCYWMEGLSEKSFDSRNYGWLCDKEIKIKGVVK